MAEAQAVLDAYFKTLSMDGGAGQKAFEAMFTDVRINGTLTPEQAGVSSAIGGAIGEAILPGVGGVVGGAIGGAVGDQLTSTGTMVDGVPIGGQLLAEPPSQMVRKYWVTKHYSNTYSWFYVYHWLLVNGKTLTYNQATKGYKLSKPRKVYHISTNPRVGDLIRADKLTDRLVAKLGSRVKKSTRKVKVTRG